jgi:hypothetical protein
LPARFDIEAQDILHATMLASVLLRRDTAFAASSRSAHTGEEMIVHSIKVDTGRCCYCGERNLDKLG